MTELHDIIKRSRRLAKTSRARYLRDIDQWITFAGEDPINWTRPRAQDFYDHLLDIRKLRPQSANRVLASLQYASKWRAHYQNRPELDFAFVEKAIARDFNEKHALDRNAITLLLAPLNGATPTDLRDFAIFVVLLETGMRRMSLISMSVDRTLIDAEQLVETKLLYPMTWVKMKGGGDKDVAIPLSDTAIAAIKPWRAWLAAHGITKGPMFRGLDSRMGPRGPIATAATTALHLNAINRMVDRRAAAAGIGHVYPHQFRHTFITWRAAAGLQPYEIASITGHAIAGLGALGDYIDRAVVAQKVRNSTPEWLRELVIK